MFFGLPWDTLIEILTVFFGAGLGAVWRHYHPDAIVPAMEKEETTEEIVRRICDEEKVDPGLALRVARCESGLNKMAVNINEGGSLDRGIFQINDKYHPEVTPAQAFDPEFSTHFFCKAFKKGNLSWWEASKKCWNA